MNFFDHKDLGNHLLQLCPKVVKHPVYYMTYDAWKLKYEIYNLCFTLKTTLYNSCQKYGKMFHDSLT